MIEVLTWILVVVAVVFFFGLTVFIHELGHFLVAKWRGLVVERFAIGFGPILWQTRKDGVEWCLCAIPFGGYVSLPQFASMEMIEGSPDAKQEELPPAKPLDKILTAFAGPLFSFAFGIWLAVIVWVAGKPVSAERMTTLVGWVEEGSPASSASHPIEPGDRILAVDSKPVRDFSASPDSIVEAIIFSKSEQIAFDMERTPPGGKVEKYSTLITPQIDKTLEIRRVGISPSTQLLVGGVLPGSPAENAGFKKGDQITTLNGVQMHSPMQFSAVVARSAGVPLRVTGLRKKSEISLVVVPQVPKDQKQAFVGIRWGDPKPQIVHIPPWQLVKDSLVSMRKTAEAVSNPNSDIKAKHLSGPLGIIQTYFAFMRQDIRLVVWFSVVLNINLAIINLLPFPVLDGGHIVLSIIEAVFRRPLPHKVLNAIQGAFASLLIAFLLYVSFYDSKRGIMRMMQEREVQEESKKIPELEFLPEPSPAREAQPVPANP